MLFIFLLYIQHNNISFVPAVERKPCISRFNSSVQSSKSQCQQIGILVWNFRKDERKVITYDKKSITIQLSVVSNNDGHHRLVRRGSDTVKMTSRKLFRFHIDSFVYTLRYFAVSFVITVIQISYRLLCLYPQIKVTESK